MMDTVEHVDVSEQDKCGKLDSSLSAARWRDTEDV